MAAVAPGAAPGVDAPLLQLEGGSTVVEPQLESVLFFGSDQGFGGTSDLVFGVQDPADPASSAQGTVPAGADQTANPDAIAGSDANSDAEEFASGSPGLLIETDSSGRAEAAVASETTQVTASSSEILWIGLAVAAALAVISVIARRRFSRRRTSR